MWPTIVSIGPIAIQSFGLMVFLGVFFGGFVWWQKGREEGLSEEELMDVWLISGLSGLVVGRAWYILSNWLDFTGSWYRMIFITKYPGLAYEGVVLGAVLMFVYQSLKKDWNIFKVLEIFVFGLIVFEIFGWFGSVLANKDLVKVGLISMGVFGVLLALIKKWEKEYRSFKWYKNERGEAKTGFLVSVYLIVVGILYLSIGFLYQFKYYFWGISSRQWFGLVWLVLGIGLLFERSGFSLKIFTKLTKTNNDKIREKNFKLKRTFKKNSRKKKGFDFL